MCQGLWANTYICVGLIGSPTSNPTPTTTQPGNGVTTPTPTQPGMVSNCNRFYLVNPGDTCGAIGAAQGVALASLYAWNPAVGSQCQSLWANVYICVGVIGGGGPTTTTTSVGNGVATPTPIQGGMVGNCRSFHLVVAGDTCYDIAAAAGVSLGNFYAWNSGVGNNCQSLWAGYYVCTAVL